MTRFGGGILSSPIFKWQHRNHNLSKAKAKAMSAHGNGRSRVPGADMGISSKAHMTEHSLDITICKNYLEPKDEVVGSSQKDSTMRAEPQDEVAMMALLSKLANLIKNRDWDQLSIDLRAHEELREYNGILLHLALRFDAPLSIISQLTHDKQTAANHRDDQGRLPLHVAISKVSQLSIISHLLKLNPRACTFVDDQGSTPLHTCFEEKVMHAFKPSHFRELVRLLIQTSPESLMIEDRDGRCPIEKAILSDSPLKTILFMNVSKRNYLRQKYDPIGYASYIENRVVLKDIEARHVSGRIGVTMFG